MYFHITDKKVDFIMEASPSSIFGSPYSDEFIYSDNSAIDIGWSYENSMFVAPIMPTAEEIRKASVPKTITKLQAMKQMKVIGKWEAFKAVLANDEDVNDEWLLSDNLNSTYPLVLGIGQLFGFTDDDMDTFFIEASKL